MLKKKNNNQNRNENNYLHIFIKLTYTIGYSGGQTIRNLVRTNMLAEPDEPFDGNNEICKSSGCHFPLDSLVRISTASFSNIDLIHAYIIMKKDVQIYCNCNLPEWLPVHLAVALGMLPDYPFLCKQ